MVSQFKASSTSNKLTRRDQTVELYHILILGMTERVDVAKNINCILFSAYLYPMTGKCAKCFVQNYYEIVTRYASMHIHLNTMD